MNQGLMAARVCVAIPRSLLVCGFLFGLTGCLEHAPSVSAGVPTLSASLIQQAYAKASNTNSEDQFGIQVALDGDTLVVGAWKEDSSGLNGIQTDNTVGDSGAVYVFTRTNGTWVQQAYLKASNAGAVDRFGVALALSGDTLAVGAWQEDSAAAGINGIQTDNSAVDSGAVYVFTRTNGSWTQQAYLKASNPGASDLFGSALALSGDTLVVGAYQEDSNATGVNGDQTDNSAGDSGAAYVFTRSGGIWSQEAYLKASNAGAGDRFGSAVTLSGDTLVVGAYQEDSAATGINGFQTDNSAADSGAAYVFMRTNGSWSQQAYLKASTVDAGDVFGSALALSGDTLVAGATGEASAATGSNGDQTDNSAVDSGAVYVFTRTNGSWTQQAYLKASNPGTSDLFGGTLALSGGTLVVGATGEGSNAVGLNGDQTDNSEGDSGAIYVFTRSGSGWSQQTYLKASNTNEFDYFGSSIALSGDRLAVGAPGEGSNAVGLNGDQADNSASNSGAVYVFQ
ncbi:MAG: FG-GAP repeat protein [Nitrospira sp.]|nr:FG-GAP repeat protein [Nitrospira sp.]